MKRKIWLLFGVIFVLLLNGCDKKNENSNSLEIYTISGSFGIDVYSYAELAGSADYVIVGKTVEELDVEYEGTMPYTSYRVKVEENLKGELRQDEPITITKQGGIAEDGKSYYVHSDDTLPVKGNSYIFYIYAQDDGSNLVVGPNSTIAVSGSNDIGITTRTVETDNESENVLEQVKEGVLNQVVRERDRSISKDDISTKE